MSWHEVQPTPEKCSRAHGPSCRSCGFTEEIKAALRDSDLADVDKIMREIARELGIEGAADANLTFLAGQILTEVRRITSSG